MESRDFKKLKTKEFLEPTKKFLENIYGLKFWKEGQDYRTFCPCPSHKENRASFFLYCKSYNGKPAEVRMRCFGECSFPRKNFDIFDLVMWLDHCSLPQAYSKVKSFMDQCEAGSPEQKKNHSKKDIDQALIYKVHEKAALYYHHILLRSKDKEVERVRGYLIQRRITLRVVRKYRLGYAPKLGSRVKGLNWYFRKDFTQKWPIYKESGLFIYLGNGYLKKFVNKEYFTEGSAAYYGDYLSGRITIPIIDEKGRVVGLQGRKVGECKKGDRYRTTRGCPKGKVLFGFYQNYDYFKKHEMYRISGQYERIYWYNQIFVVEGVFDVIRADAFLHPIPGGCPFVATLGGPLTSEQVNIIARHVENLHRPQIILFFDGGEERFILESYRLLQENPATRDLPIGFKLLQRGADPADFYTVRKGAICRRCAKEDELEKEIYPFYTLDLPLPGYMDLLHLIVNRGKTSHILPYRVDKEKLISLLSVDKKGLNGYEMQKYLEKIVRFIRKSDKESRVNGLDIPTTFVAPETVKAVGGALILLLDFWIQQREKKKSLRPSVEDEMKRLKISRRTYFKYQRILVDLGFIEKEKDKLKIRYSPKKLSIKIKSTSYDNKTIQFSNLYLPPKGTNLNICIL